MRTLLIALFFAFFCTACYSQSGQKIIDSLKYQLTIVRQDTNRVILLTSLCNMYRQVNTDSSKLFGEEAIDLARQINFPSGEVSALQSLSAVLRIQGDIPNSLKFRLEALKVLEDKLPQMDKTNIWVGIGLIYLDINDYEKAKIYFKKTIALGEKNSYGNALINIERAYTRNNQLDSAWYFAQKAYDYTKTPNASPIYSALVMDMGIIQYKKGNKNLAFSYLHESISECINAKDHRTISDAYSTLSGFYKETNQPDSSIFYAQKGLIEGQTIGYQKGILNNATVLADLYGSRDVQKSLFFYKIAKTASDELYGVKKVQALQKIIADEQERQRNIETERIRTQNQLKQHALLFGLGIMFLIGYILYRNNQQKQKANAVLKQTLTHLKATQTQLIQSEKLASLGELTAGIAHEIQNPLNFVNNFSELSVDLAKDLNDEIHKPDIDKGYVEELLTDLSQNQEKINHHGKRASSIVKGMLEHSRASTGLKELTDINKLADEYLRLSYHGLRAKDKSFNADFTTHFDENLPEIEVIPQDIGRVLLNLINNAFYAVNQRALPPQHPGGEPYQPTVIVSTLYTTPPLGAGGQIIIKVKDNGSGMSEATKIKVFQPFFTTKPTGQGTGLGLSLAYDIVTKGHGGTLEVESTEGVGSEFIISLFLKN